MITGLLTVYYSCARYNRGPLTNQQPKGKGVQIVTLMQFTHNSPALTEPRGGLQFCEICERSRSKG